MKEFSENPRDLLADSVDPPLLDWISYEAGTPGQLPLFPSWRQPGFAERCFVALAKEWRLRWEAPRRGPPAREVDEFLLSALLLADSHGQEFTFITHDLVHENASLAYQNNVLLDYLAWRVVGCRLATESRPSLVQAVRNHIFGSLVADIAHSGSQVRVWAMELGWLVRRQLPREPVLRSLCQNIATALVGVDMSLAFSFELCSNAEEWAAVMEEHRIFQPESYRSQYEARIQDMRNSGYSLGRHEFLSMEVQCHRHLFALACQLGRGPSPT